MTSITFPSRLRNSNPRALAAMLFATALSALPAFAMATTSSSPWAAAGGEFVENLEGWAFVAVTAAVIVMAALKAFDGAAVQGIAKIGVGAIAIGGMIVMIPRILTGMGVSAALLPLF